MRRHTRNSILDNFERRLANSVEAERAAALEEIGHITRLRLVEAVEGPGKPKTDGRLSTHVLDTVSGRPAAGVKIVLKELGSSAEGLLKETITNADGRTDAPLLGGGPLRIGSYEIAFHIGAYFAAQGGGDEPAAVPRRGADPLRHRRARGRTTTCPCWPPPGPTRPIGAAETWHRYAETASLPPLCRALASPCVEGMPSTRRGGGRNAAA